MTLKNKPATTDIERLSKIYLTDANNKVIWIRIVQSVTEDKYITKEGAINKNQPNLYKLSMLQYLEYLKHWTNVIQSIK